MLLFIRSGHPNPLLFVFFFRISPTSPSPPEPTSVPMTVSKLTMIQSDAITENRASSTPTSTLGEANASNTADEFPVLAVCLIAGFSLLLLIFLLVAILAIKYRRRIRFFSKNNNAGSNKNATDATILPKASYRQKNKNKNIPAVTFREQTDSLQNRDYATLSNYSKIEPGRPASKSGPLYDQLEANKPISKSTPAYSVLEPEHQTQTDQKDVLHDEYDKLLRPQSPDSRGRDRTGSNHSDYHPTVVTRNDYDHIDRNSDVTAGAKLNVNEYSTTISNLIDSDRAYDHLDRSNNDGNKGLNVVSSATYNDVVKSPTYNEVQLSTVDAKNGGSSHKNEILGDSSPYEKTIIK
ncbi:hypothetical protein HOLleu_20034 [Holothuria leucospilota]|uniref:Uncharacterized protein n=1 Tax=Holothuria leucospilota TaxID=206669 RepID=A0A9Q1H7P0_HOLLE|nr:hypothetical protein HOLleu_20034 [Holothuria leucospilota]